MFVATRPVPTSSPKYFLTNSSFPANPPVAKTTASALIVRIPPSSFSALIPLISPFSMINSVAFVEYKTSPPYFQFVHVML